MRTVGIIAAILALMTTAVTTFLIVVCVIRHRWNKNRIAHQKFENEKDHDLNVSYSSEGPTLLIDK